jgi:hypothetical protein
MRAKANYEVHIHRAVTVRILRGGAHSGHGRVEVSGLGRGELRTWLVPYAGEPGGSPPPDALVQRAAGECRDRRPRGQMHVVEWEPCLYARAHDGGLFQLRERGIPALVRADRPVLDGREPSPLPGWRTPTRRAERCARATPSPIHDRRNTLAGARPNS